MAGAGGVAIPGEVFLVVPLIRIAHEHARAQGHRALYAGGVLLQERVFRQRLHRGGQVHGLDDLVSEGKAPYGFQAFPKFKRAGGLQVVLGGERQTSDALHAGRHIDAGEVVAGEGIAADGGDAFRNLHLGEALHPMLGIAAAESPVGNLGQTRGKIHPLQSGVGGKGAPAQAGDGIGQDHAGQLIVLEGRQTHGSDPGGPGHVRQPVGAKRPIPDGLQEVWQLNGLESFALRSEQSVLAGGACQRGYRQIVRGIGGQHQVAIDLALVNAAFAQTRDGLAAKGEVGGGPSLLVGILGFRGALVHHQLLEPGLSVFRGPVHVVDAVLVLEVGGFGIHGDHAAGQGLPLVLVGLQLFRRVGRKGLDAGVEGKGFLVHYLGEVGKANAGDVVHGKGHAVKLQHEVGRLGKVHPLDLVLGKALGLHPPDGLGKGYLGELVAQKRRRLYHQHALGQVQVGEVVLGKGRFANDEVSSLGDTLGQLIVVSAHHSRRKDDGGQALFPERFRTHANDQITIRVLGGNDQIGLAGFQLFLTLSGKAADHVSRYVELPGVVATVEVVGVGLVGEVIGGPNGIFGQGLGRPDGHDQHCQKGAQGHSGGLMNCGGGRGGKVPRVVRRSERGEVEFCHGYFLISTFLQSATSTRQGHAFERERPNAGTALENAESGAERLWQKRPARSTDAEYATEHG